MLTLFTVKMKWHYDDKPSVAKFCAVTQEEADFLSCFLICWGKDLKLLFNRRYEDEEYPNNDIVKYKLKLLVAALNKLFPQGAHILAHMSDYDIIQVAVYRLNDLTGWKFKNKEGYPASIVNYTTEDLSDRDIVSIEEIEELVRKKHLNNPYIDEDGSVFAAIKREHKRLLHSAKE